jgi:hypothetical protein
MIKKMVIAVCILFVLGISVVGLVFAQTVTPGVSYGNVFTYSLSANWSSNQANITLPVDLGIYNNTVSYVVNITGTSGSTVLTSNTWSFTNGTKTTSSGYLDLSSGNSTGSGFPWIIGANLVAGDLLHPLGSDFLTINETVARSYSSGERDANHVTWTYPASSSNPETETVNLYADKSTGMLVELHDTTSSTNPNLSITITWTLVSTNVNGWVISGITPTTYTLVIVIVAIVIIVLVAILLYRMRSGRRRHRR